MEEAQFQNRCVWLTHQLKLCLNLYSQTNKISIRKCPQIPLGALLQDPRNLRLHSLTYVITKAQKSVINDTCTN